MSVPWQSDNAAATAVDFDGFLGGTQISRYFVIISMAKEWLPHRGTDLLARVYVYFW